MSEIEAELDRAAAAYWMSVAAKGGGGKTVALSKAEEFLRGARGITHSGRRGTTHVERDAGTTAGRA